MGQPCGKWLMNLPGKAMARYNKEAINIKQFNDLFAKREKLIIVTGIKEIPNSLVSVYNTDGNSEASLFDDQ